MEKSQERRLSESLRWDWVLRVFGMKTTRSLLTSRSKNPLSHLARFHRLTMVPRPHWLLALAVMKAVVKQFIKYKGISKVGGKLKFKKCLFWCNNFVIYAFFSTIFILHGCYKNLL